MLFNKNELLEALKTELVDHNIKTDFVIEEVVIDSRKTAPQKLFFALRGENNNGHNFLEQVFENGCEACIIDDEALFKKFSHNQNYHQNHFRILLILVKNTFVALNKLAEFSRARSQAKIIAITGSVGKTGTKEMLRDAFSKQGKTHATTGNLNNHIGLPLTLCNMPSNTQFAILEMGMNHLQEIEPLSKLARPHIAAITTIAPAHIGNFKNEEEIALAKSEIFSGLEPKGIAIINRDNKYFEFLKNRALLAKILPENILSFGKNLESNYCLEKVEIHEKHNNHNTNDHTKNSIYSEAFATTKNHGKISYKISTINQSTINNSLIVLACLDLTSNQIEKSLQILQNLVTAKGRGEIIKKTIDDKKITIIDDTYNANVASMKSGIEYLLSLKKILNKKRAIIVLGDMFELGDKSAYFHDEVLEFANNAKVDFAFLAGDEMNNSAKILSGKCKTYKNSTDLSLDITNFLQDDDILLVKGSRGMKMEKAVEEILKTSNI